MTKDEIKFRRRLRDELKNVTNCKDAEAIRLMASDLLDRAEMLTARKSTFMEEMTAIVTVTGGAALMIVALAKIITQDYTTEHLIGMGLGVPFAVVIFLLCARAPLLLKMRKHRYKRAILKAVKNSDHPHVVESLEVAL